MQRHRILALLFACCFALTGRGEGEPRWEHLAVGMNETEVASALGTPLIVNGARGLVQWTFDAGGLVMFQQGILLFWGTPRGYQPTPIENPIEVVTLELPAPVDPAPTSSSTTTLELPPSSPHTPMLSRPQSEVRVATFDELRKS